MSTVTRNCRPGLVRVGPFELIQPVATGSTATVWRGVHRRSGVPVAIKVLTHARWRDEKRGGPLELEVRTLARLNHPAVIAVHDYGWLTASDETASRGALIAGCPYVVMDWHGGGTLSGFAPADFASLRAILLRLLDALAHVHARGLIHRDLKPANVLIGRDGVILTDLGLAYSLTEIQGAEIGVCGTPNYIAPEQVAMHPWHFGPWTDLYALGCLTWTLVTRTPPFRRANPHDTLFARLRDPLPRFVPVLDVPEGFEDWLRRLLVRAPTGRFRCAADATRALLEVSGAPSGSESVAAGPVWTPQGPDDATISDVTVATGSTTVLPEAEPTTLGALSTTWSMPALDLSAAAGPNRASAADEQGDASRAFPDWRIIERGPRASFADCGRGLTRLRQPTMCGRIEARDRLWASLSRVSTERQSRVAIIDGATGVGKTRLAEWLCARAHELGLAETLWVGASQHRFQASRLWSMFARRIGRRGVSSVELFKHLTESLALDETMARTLTDLSARRSVEPQAEGIEANEREGFICTLEAITLLARQRPVVLAVDDAHRDEVIPRFVTYALQRRPDLPILYVLTVDRTTDEMELGPGRLFDALSTRFGAPIVLGPLAPRTTTEITAQRLALDPAVLQPLSAASRGNPMYASVVIQHWLDIGALAESAVGHALRDGVPGWWPQDVVAAWSLRLEHLLSDLPDGAEHALELAAALGSPFARATWVAACRAAGLPPPDALRAALIDLDVLEIGSGDRLALGHPLLARALLDSAQRSGRSSRWHAVCADLLLAARPDASVGADRVAHHLAAAGRHAEAMPWWFEAISTATRLTDQSARRDHLRAAMRSSRAMRVRRTSATWIRLKRDWTRFRLRRPSPLALRHARQGAALAFTLTDAHAPLAAEVLELHARASRQLQLFDEATTAIVHAERIAQAAGDPTLVAANSAMRCHIAYSRRDLDRAWGHNRDALALAREHGPRPVLVDMLILRGELARGRGELDEAEAAYREAERLAPLRASRVVCMCNLSSVHLERGDVDGARREAERARWAASRLHAPLLEAVAATFMLAAVAPSGAREAWDDAWRSMKLIRDLQYCELDLARTIDRAARSAWPKMPRRALDAARSAMKIYRAISPSPELSALERWLGARSRPV